MIFNQNKEWRMAIDPINEEKNWFVKKKRTYGNPTFILRIIISISLFYVCVNSVAYYQTSVGVQIAVLFICFVIPAIIGHYLFFTRFRHQTHDDCLKIRQELIVTLSVITILVCVIFIFYALYVISDEKHKKQVLSDYASYGWAILRVTLLFLVGIYPKYLLRNYSNVNHNGDRIEKDIFEKYIFWMCICDKCICHSGYKKQNHSNKTTYSMSLLDETKWSEKDGNRNSISGINTNGKKKPLSWMKIVSSYDGYEALMLHLESEFSIENLLFIQEVCLLYLLCTHFCFGVGCMCLLILLTTGCVVCVFRFVYLIFFYVIFSMYRLKTY